MTVKKKPVIVWIPRDTKEIKELLELLEGKK